jgi:hypothetical protein
MGEVGGVVQEIPTLVQRLANELVLFVVELHHGLLEIPDTSVNELGGFRRRA